MDETQPDIPDIPSEFKDSVSDRTSENGDTISSQNPLNEESQAGDASELSVSESTDETVPNQTEESAQNQEELRAQAEEIARNAQEVLVYFFKEANSMVGDVERIVNKFQRGGSETLDRTLRDVNYSISSLEGLRRGGDRLGQVSDDLHFIKRGLEKALDSIKSDHSVVNSKRFVGEFYQTEAEWIQRGGVDRYAEDLMTAMETEDLELRDKAFTLLKRRMEDVGVKVSHDAKSQAVSMDHFTTEVGKQVMHQVALGMEVDAELRTRMPEESRSIRGRLYNSLEDVSGFSQGINRSVEDLPKAYFGVASKADRLVDEMRGVLEAAKQIRLQKAANEGEASEEPDDSKRNLEEQKDL